jgi:hypothetical protein
MISLATAATECAQDTAVGNFTYYRCPGKLSDTARWNIPLAC